MHLLYFIRTLSMPHMGFIWRFVLHAWRGKKLTPIIWNENFGYEWRKTLSESFWRASWICKNIFHYFSFDSITIFRLSVWVGVQFQELFVWDKTFCLTHDWFPRKFQFVHSHRFSCQEWIVHVRESQMGKCEKNFFVKMEAESV